MNTINVRISLGAYAALMDLARAEGRTLKTALDRLLNVPVVAPTQKSTSPPPKQPPTAAPPPRRPTLVQPQDSANQAQIRELSYEPEST